MVKAVVTVKGQIVIPSKLRRKFGIKKGTQVYVYERDGEIAISQLPTITSGIWPAWRVLKENCSRP
jgi:AbrB family looped-hinge helix DNA binding protein